MKKFKVIQHILFLYKTDFIYILYILDMQYILKKIQLYRYTVIPIFRSGKKRGGYYKEYYYGIFIHKTLYRCKVLSAHNIKTT